MEILWRRKKIKPIPIRRSTAEHLTYIAPAVDQPESVEVRYEDENIWFIQKMLTTLYDVDVRTINEHICNIFKDCESEEMATIRKFQIVQREGGYRVLNMNTQITPHDKEALCFGLRNKPSRRNTPCAT